MFENQLFIIIVSSCKFLRHGQFHDHWIIDHWLKFSSEHVGCAFESCLVEAFTKSNICAPGGASCEVSCLNLELASFIQNGTRSSNWKRKTDRASCVSWNTCTHTQAQALCWKCWLLFPILLNRSDGSNGSRILEAETPEFLSNFQPKVDSHTLPAAARAARQPGYQTASLRQNLGRSPQVVRSKLSRYLPVQK